MAQKAAKQTAKKNQSTLSTLHLISVAVNIFFILWRFFIHAASTSKRAVWLYMLLNAPAVGIQLYFESIGRPKGAKAGEDLSSGGLMELMWDVVYVTWACLVLVAFLGEWAWWLWAVIPVYGSYAAYTTATGMKNSLGGLGGPANDMAVPNASKRQAKLEKRSADGKNVRYR